MKEGTEKDDGEVVLNEDKFNFKNKELGKEKDQNKEEKNNNQDNNSNNRNSDNNKSNKGMNEEKLTGRTKLDLNERDLKILAAVERWGILGIGQLNNLVPGAGEDDRARVRMIFNDTERKDYWTRIYKRVERLRQAGYLQAEHQPRVYLLTDKGHETLKQKGGARLRFFRNGISRHLVDHELLVAGVGMLIEEFLGYEARAVRERGEMQRGGWRPAPRRGIPDLWIVDPTMPKAVEVELHGKAQAEYQQIWSAYRLRLRGKGAVLYLTTMPDGVRTILHYARAYEADFIFACDLKEFRQSFGRAPFEGFQEGRRILIEPRLNPDKPVGRLTPPTQRVPALSPALLSQGGLTL